MEDITIPMDVLNKHNLDIPEYLTLYDIAHGYCISNKLGPVFESVVSLERKGFIKIVDGKIILRDKSNDLFSFKRDLFEQWLELYPTRVKTKFGDYRALSPANPGTILGKKLRASWVRIFRKNIEKQEMAIKVLKAEIAAKTKSGKLEYMVQATRWLNEGYHEKYSFLIDEAFEEENNYTDEDYM